LTFSFFLSFVFFLDIEKDFKEQLRVLIPEVFRKDNENFIKEINGEQITSADLFEYFKVFKFLIKTKNKGKSRFPSELL